MVSVFTQLASASLPPSAPVHSLTGAYGGPEPTCSSLIPSHKKVQLSCFLWARIHSAGAPNLHVCLMWLPDTYPRFQLLQPGQESVTPELNFGSSLDSQNPANLNLLPDFSNTSICILCLPFSFISPPQPPSSYSGWDKILASVSLSESFNLVVCNELWSQTKWVSMLNMLGAMGWESGDLDSSLQSRDGSVRRGSSAQNYLHSSVGSNTLQVRFACRPTSL